MIDRSTAVKWSWRKKTVKANEYKSLPQNPRYILSNDNSYITYGFRCVIREDGTYPVNTEPCNDGEIRRLDKAYKMRNNITD